MKKKMAILSLIVIVAVILTVALVGCGSANVEDLEGRWTLTSYTVMGIPMVTFFREITFDANGGFTALPPVGSTEITGNVAINNRGRITFTGPDSEINSFFSTWEYNVEISGNTMTWTWEQRALGLLISDGVFTWTRA